MLLIKFCSVLYNFCNAVGIFSYIFYMNIFLEIKEIKVSLSFLEYYYFREYSYKQIIVYFILYKILKIHRFIIFFSNINLLMHILSYRFIKSIKTLIMNTK